jgi:RimJ/RimL family protein N-acetyltransferase
MQPTLTTVRLELRPADDADGDALWSLWREPSVRRFLWDDRVITRAEAFATLADCRALGPQGLGLWVLAPRIEPASPPAPALAEAVLGCAGLLPVSTAAEYEPRLTGLVEPLVALAPPAWGQGYAHEALVALRDYAASVLGLRQLAGVTDVPNEASDRMLRRAGFVPLSEVTGPKHPLRTYVWQAGGPGASGAAAGERDVVRPSVTHHGTMSG